MKIVFMGTPDFAVGTLEALIRAGHEVAAVVTKVDKPVGRKMELRPSPVKVCAVKNGIKVLQPAKIRGNAEFMDELKSISPDVIVVAAYGKIIPKEILELPKYGCLNVHASLLPKYRGAAPIQWAVIDGEKESGVSIMQMNEGLDTGDVIAKTVVPLDEKETGGSLFDRLAKAGAELLVETLPKVEKGEITPVPQPAESPTPYARMIRKEDGRIDWTKSAAVIERLVRGMNPWPSAFTHYNGKMLKIWEADVLPEEEDDPDHPEPGTVVRAGDDGILVSTGSGLLCIRELQLEGKKRMKAADFLRGHQLEPGVKLQ
ncbi:MAG: methionyl-tRNA formyltransferase [Eubacteriales bacterium]|jgi:methionyl-tRNA formyltransferase